MTEENERGGEDKGQAGRTHRQVTAQRWQQNEPESPSAVIYCRVGNYLHGPRTSSYTVKCRFFTLHKGCHLEEN